MKTRGYQEEEHKMNLRYKWHLSYSNTVISRYKCMSVLWLSYLRYERDFIVPIYQEKTIDKWKDLSIYSRTHSWQIEENRYL